MKKIIMLMSVLCVSTAFAKKIPLYDFTTYSAGYHVVPDSVSFGPKSITIENPTDHPIGVMVEWTHCEDTELRLAAKQSVKLKKEWGCEFKKIWGSLWVKGRRIEMINNSPRAGGVGGEQRWIIAYDPVADKAYLNYGGYWDCIMAGSALRKECLLWGWRQ